MSSIAPAAWNRLAQRAIEPNGYFLPDWAQAVSASARGRTDASVLTARGGDTSELIGVLPVVSLWRAYGLPLPALATADPYGTLGTPIVDRERAVESFAALLADARRTGARALLLRDMSIGGAAMEALREALARAGSAPMILRQHERACLHATADADLLLRDALGPKKLKELRRLRNRLADHGEVAFEVATTPAEVAAALPGFLDLEASGWKGSRGTALKQHPGDDTFIRRAVSALSGRGQCEIATLRVGDMAVAAGIVLRHLDRAFYFKLGVDERFARYSVGVQLTLELTRRFCDDPAITLVDSTAAPGHPMIDPIWRGRIAIGDVLVPLRQNDPWVAIIRQALSTHRVVRAHLRQAFQVIRTVREKFT